MHIVVVLKLHSTPNVYWVFVVTSYYLLALATLYLYHTFLLHYSCLALSYSATSLCYL